MENNELMSNPTFDGATVCIAGGAGFVGSNLAKMLLREDVKKVILVDNLLSADMSNVPDDPRVEFIPRSITNPEVLERLPEDLDYAYQLTTFHGNQSSIADPMRDHMHNNYTSLSMFHRLSQIKNLKKVVYAAAACAVAEKTYGEATATDEEAPVSLFHDSPYSVSKIIGELYGNYYWKQENLPFVKARFMNVYGPGEILGAGRWRGTVHTIWRNVTPTFVFKSLNQEALPLDDEGRTSRDFIFVEDMARGLMAAALNGKPSEAYNLASGKETTIRELAETINRLTENPSAVELKPRRPWDSSGNRFGSAAKAERDLGFKAQVGIEEGLQRTVDWTRENMHTIKRCMEQHTHFVPEIKTYL